MSTLSLSLPDSLYRRIKEFSEKEGVSINQFISSAVAEKMSAFATEDYLKQRASRGSAKKMKEILAKVPDREPLPEDIL